MHRQNQGIVAIQLADTQVGTFGNDPLVTYQSLETFDQRPAGHQGVTDHMERRRAHYLAHVQANGRVARQLHRQLPEPRHRVLGETGVRIFQRIKVQSQLIEQHTTIQAVHFQRLDNPHRPA